MLPTSFGSDMLISPFLSSWCLKTFSKLLLGHQFMKCLCRKITPEVIIPAIIIWWLQCFVSHRSSANPVRPVGESMDWEDLPYWIFLFTLNLFEQGFSIWVYLQTLNPADQICEHLNWNDSAVSHTVLLELIIVRVAQFEAKSLLPSSECLYLLIYQGFP